MGEYRCGDENSPLPHGWLKLSNNSHSMPHSRAPQGAACDIKRGVMALDVETYLAACLLSLGFLLLLCSILSKRCSSRVPFVSDLTARREHEKALRPNEAQRRGECCLIHVLPRDTLVA